MTDITVFAQQFQTEDRSWLLTVFGREYRSNIQLDVTAFTQGTHYPNGYIPSGTPLGKITASGLWGPYSGTTDEVQSVTEGGSGLTSFTLTFSGQTTSSIPAASTAATVQAAIAALSNVGVGNVAVTGATSGPYSVSFIGTLLDTDVAQMTATPTGGSGTVTVATTTAGGADASSDGRQVCTGLLASAVRVVRGDGSVLAKVGGAQISAFAAIDPAKLPFTLDANGQTDLKANFIRCGA